MIIIPNPTPVPVVVMGGSKPPPTIIGSLPFFNTPNQVVGFVPLLDCAFSECREFDEICCWKNTVFGDKSLTANVPSYENDWNTFLVSFTRFAINPTAYITMTLQRCSSETWSDVATLNDNTYGIYYKLGTIASHKTYAGYAINWGKVVSLQGVGCYRIKMLAYPKKGTLQAPAVAKGCLVSPGFELLEWDCSRAHGTVKFEAWMIGKIGSVTTDYKVFDLCGINWYDSIRLKGFFGEQKFKYDSTVLEYQTGMEKIVRDEAIKSFKYYSNYFPKYLHDRFGVYGMMADTLLVSDYNDNNSDYFLLRKQILKAGAYEPVYLDENGIRRSKVTVDFEAGIQSIIKSICCETVQGSAP